MKTEEQIRQKHTAIESSFGQTFLVANRNNMPHGEEREKLSEECGEFRAAMRVLEWVLSNDVSENKSLVGE